jgi:hypothetical protein
MKNITAIIREILGAVGSSAANEGNIIAPTRPQHSDARSKVGGDLGIAPDRFAEPQRQETVAGTMRDIEASGFFKPDKMVELQNLIDNSILIGHGYIDPFSYDDLLSLEEKKELGLNTRLKISRQMVSFMTEKGLALKNPKDAVKNMCLKNFHAVARKYELIRMKDAGIEKVKILDCGDERDCSKIKRFKKIWPIDQVPELPLPGCTSAYL